jgi:hypothetical protein
MKFPQRGKGSSSSPKTSLFQRNYWLVSSLHSVSFPCHHI